MANQQRRRRVADQIQKELSEIIRLELNDPRVGMITISDVEIAADFSLAKIFYTVLGDMDARERAQQGLRRASGFLRATLGGRLHIHNSPELRFLFDASIENGVRLSQLIDQAVALKALDDIPAPVKKARKRVVSKKVPAKKRAKQIKAPPSSA
ncbi:MAG: 30S ribosome-binding factor RbfA [Burkholderiales bacterium]